MSKNLLHTLLVRNQDLSGLIRQVAEASDARVWVENAQGMLLFGTPEEHYLQRIPVMASGVLLGYVSGCEKAPMIAGWLEQLATLEENRKKLGAEVLHLYRELNLIFDFSEKLASVASLDSIAQLTLLEAGRLISFEQGVVFLQTDPSNPGQKIAEIGVPIDPVLLTTQLQEGESAAIIDLEKNWALFAPLKVSRYHLGNILLLRGQAEEFSAADLKLLTTLAFQSASAMERSIYYESATAQALEQQRRQLIFDLAMRDPFFRKVVATIEQRMGDPAFSVEQLSQAILLSPSQLQRKILALTEKSPGQIIRNIRLQKAKELLRSTDLNVAEVAFQCGFSDPSYFTRIFRKEEGIPPSQWKEEQEPA
ncbi:MAG: helix-turn-helix domain-containing protein [Lewinellaceae bacterium]|nr:helix-turn-helix domain-containing protein [Lewinellaceae bacterium]